MDERDFDGSLVLEQLAAIGKVARSPRKAQSSGYVYSC
jgi:hypothetical protein